MKGGCIDKYFYIFIIQDKNEKNYKNFIYINNNAIC